MSDPFGRVQRTAPAVTPPADVVIGPPRPVSDGLMTTSAGGVTAGAARWTRPNGSDML